MKHVKLFEAFTASTNEGVGFVGKPVLKIAAESPNLKTFVSAITAADLIKTLNGNGPFTIFAPSDEAFAKLPMGTLEDLLKPENKEKLKSILTNHVVSANLKSGDLKDGQMVDILGKQFFLGNDGPNQKGKELKVAIQNGEITIDGEALKMPYKSKVSTPDLIGGNGVIHVVDNVILPK
jgi:uncharacterized surface protein with fasciclin (FAS1) repeats